MSNETDLDWLARNVHVWPDGKEECLVVRSGNPYPIWSVCKSSCGWIMRSEWLARRAELQNKPSWEDVPEWAEWIAQSPNGHWEFFSAKPIAYKWWRHPLDVKSKANDASKTGLILGDWRDTLEKRPEQLKPSIEEANRLAQEFTPFTSIEDNQDREGVNQKLNELEMLGKVSHLISYKRHRITTSKYTKTIHGVPVDVYDVLQAWGVINPALQHLIKKALQCGQRGHKDNAQDLQDIIDSAIRAKELG